MATLKADIKIKKDFKLHYKNERLKQRTRFCFIRYNVKKRLKQQTFVNLIITNCWRSMIA